VSGADASTQDEASDGKLFISVYRPEDWTEPNGKSKSISRSILTVLAEAIKRRWPEAEVQVNQRQTDLWNGRFVPFQAGCNPNETVVFPDDRNRAISPVLWYRALLTLRSGFLLDDWSKGH
jgi:hypothetical protein